MDLSWLGDPTLPVSQLLIGATGNLIGNLATQVVNGLLEAGTRPMRRLFQQPEEHLALEEAMAQALAVTLAWLTDDRDEAAHLATLLRDWLQREAVADELYRLIEPTPDHEIDLVRLTEEFVAAGWDPAWLGERHSFAELVETLATAFTTAAAQQPLLQGVIQIGALRTMVARLTQLVQETIQQTSLLQQIAVTLERFHPLALEKQEQSYLRGLYHDCNDLALARDDRADPSRQGPRLQRVYVGLYLAQKPTPEQFLTRLGIPQTRWKQTQRALKSALGEAAGDRRWRTNLTQFTGRAADEWAETLRWLEQPDRTEKRAALEKKLKLAEGALSQALVDLKPLEALQAQSQIVILGDPGSGKSTLTQRLAALLAAAGSDDPKLLADLDEPEVAELATLLNHLGRRVLPVRVVLNRWAQQLAATATGCADDLINECVRLIGQAGNVAPLKEHFMARLQTNPPTALLLLDGLDEVTDEVKRATLLAAIEHFHDAYGTTPLMVTCRIRPYSAWRKGKSTLSLPDYTLAPLNPAAVAQFLQRWHAELVRTSIYQPEQALTAQRQLLNAINDATRAELGEMAGTPLLLTMMARVNYHSGLPNSRAELYERFVEQLLYEWERQKQDTRGQLTGLERLLQAADVRAGSLARALNELAYTIHGQRTTGDSQRDTVDIPVGLLRTALEQIHPGTRSAKASWAIDVLDLMADRSGLINAIDTTPGAEIYKFSHRTFQEYLAARWLATGETGEKLLKFKAHLAEEGWREAFLLGIGYLTTVLPNYDDALLIIDALLPSSINDEQRARQIVLLGEAYIHLLGPQRAQEAVNRKVADQVAAHMPPLLTTAMQHRELPARLRLDAGLLLADLNLLPDDLDDLVTINAVRSLGYEFRIGKYPVTNHQYRRFVEAGGYADKQWWSEEGLRCKQQYRWQEPHDWDDPRFHRCTQPVVGISWYDAEAYCHWLTALWRQEGKISNQEAVRLPTRTEWVAAARSKHGKEYPWGTDEFDPGCANTQESNLGQTTPVHMYPAGRTKDGVWDMAGNVFEWTANCDERDKDMVWVKGGSLSTNNDCAKALFTIAGPFRFHRSVSFGCRVVVVPISRSGF